MINNNRKPKTGAKISKKADIKLKNTSFSLFITRYLTVRREIFEVHIFPQLEGNYVSRMVTNRFNATGQGKTEEEAIADIKDAIETLIEEEANPSGDVQWPEDYR